MLETPESREYDLIRKVCLASVFSWSSDPLLGLFQKHFFLHHCLYSLKRDLQAEGKSLDISPIKIQLYSFLEPCSQEVSSSSSTELENYYADWAHFKTATTENISELMAQFWLGFHAQDKRGEALDVLGLKPTATWNDIKNTYQKLIATAHPDKGGVAEEFHQLRAAYETLSITEKPR